jgi:hypothetical protein
MLHMSWQRQAHSAKHEDGVDNRLEGGARAAARIGTASAEALRFIEILALLKRERMRTPKMDIFQEGSLPEGSIIDPAYEFCAPQYFDFSKPEDEFGQEAMQAETWFDMKTVPDEISRESSAYEQDCML